MSLHRAIVTVLCLNAIGFDPVSSARELPYSIRTKNYSAWSTQVTGDLRTLGMAGATAALPVGMDSGFSNPANLPILITSYGIQLTGNRVFDGNIQDYGSNVDFTHLAVGLDSYPWGFVVGYRISNDEGQNYELPSLNQTAFFETFVRDFYLGVGRTMLNHQLSLGIALRFGEAVRRIDFLSESSPDLSHSSWDIGMVAGISYQFPSRWIWGLSLETSGFYPASPEINTTQAEAGVEDFFQPTTRPTIVAMGVGWVPNRFFQTGFSLYLIGPQEDTALLSSNDQVVGKAISLQPRVGGTYRFAEFKEFTSDFSLGSYLEVSRIEARPTRLHGTTSLEVNPWVLNFGIGLDLAPQYKDYIFTVGVDVIKLFRKWDLIPPKREPLLAGWFPAPLHNLTEGLPRGLNRDWKPSPYDEDILEVGKKFPERLKRRLEKTGEQLEDILR